MKSLTWPLLAALLTLPALADEMSMSHSGMDHSAMQGSMQPTDAASHGVIRKIDGNKLTLKHGPLTNLGMPAMTMTFEAVTPSDLNGLQVGDKVRFTARTESSKLLAEGIAKE